MENENIGKLDALIQEVEEELSNVDDDERYEELQEKLNGLNSLKEDYSKKDELINNQKTRAEKAEEELKGFKKTEEKSEEEVTPTPKTEGNLSQRDLLALVKADVHEDDIDEVLDYARLKGIDVKDALQSSIVKTILTEREEERKTAEATATSTQRSTQRTPKTKVLENAKAGKLPDDDDGINALVNAQFNK